MLSAVELWPDFIKKFLSRLALLFAFKSGCKYTDRKSGFKVKKGLCYRDNQNSNIFVWNLKT